MSCEALQPDPFTPSSDVLPGEWRVAETRDNASGEWVLTRFTHPDEGACDVIVMSYVVNQVGGRGAAYLLARDEPDVAGLSYGPRITRMGDMVERADAAMREEADA